MKILIAVPTFETISPETFKSIYDLEKPSWHDVVFDFVKGYDCADARNRIAKKSLSGGFDRLMMIDSDITVPEKAIVQLLEHDSHIVLGCYPRKNSKKGETELFKPGYPDFSKRFLYEELTKERMTVKGGGMGCVMMDTRLFYQLPFPWFEYMTYDDGTKFSEDLFFCEKATIAGFSIEADTRVRCGHLTRAVQYE